MSDPGNDYIFIWGNTQSLLTRESDMIAYQKHRENIWNEREKKVLSVSRNHRISSYLSRADVERQIETGKLFFDAEYVNKFFSEVEQTCRDHQAMFARLKQTNFNSLNKDELFSCLEETVSQWARIIGYFRATQMEGTHYLTEQVTGRISAEEASVLLLPSELDPINREEIAWQEILKSDYSENKLLDHARQYPWIVAYHFTYSDVLKTLSERYREDKQNKEFKDIMAEKAKLKARQTEILKAHPDLVPAVGLLNRLALARIAIKSCWAGNDFYQIPLLGDIASRTGEDVNDIANYYLLADIRELLNGKKIGEEEKAKIRRCHVFQWKDGAVQITSGDEAEAIVQAELGEESVVPVTEIKGQAVSPGKATGKVRVLESNNVEQARDFRTSFAAGEILVTQMTQPNIVDIAKRAGAIITDEGGMLSHAAIVSREFKIPCVVGTHQATKVFKDGDLVEVDANNGVVRIIK